MTAQQFAELFITAFIIVSGWFFAALLLLRVRRLVRRVKQLEKDVQHCIFAWKDALAGRDKARKALNKSRRDHLDTLAICKRMSSLLFQYGDDNDELAAKVAELTKQRDALLRKLCVLRLEYEAGYTEEWR